MPIPDHVLRAAYLDSIDAARLLATTPTLIRRWCRTGSLPAKKVHGTRWRIFRDDVLRFAFAHGITPCPREKN